MTDLIQKIKDVKDNLNNLIDSAGSDIFRNAVQPIFDVDKEVKAVRWNQYIPGFNDGEPCTFSMGDIKVCYGDEKEADSESDDNFLCQYSEKVSKKRSLKKAMSDVNSLLSLLKGVAERIFESNAEITITRSGKVERDYYECGH